MARELAKAADLRNFAVAARQRPQEGGYVYASGAANYCSFIRHYVKSLREKHAAAAASSNKPTVLQRLQTLDRMEARCQSFTDAELVELGSNEFRREGLARGDPLLRVQHDLWGGQQHIPPRDTEKQRAFLTALIDAGDPWLLDSLRGVAQVWEANAKDPSSYLDGVRFGGLSGTAAYFDAWDLVQCTIGESCDKLNQPEVEVACVEKGTCFEDRFQLIRHNLKDRPGEYEKLMAVYTRLLEIVRIRDVNALLPPDRLKGYRFG